MDLDEHQCIPALIILQTLFLHLLYKQYHRITNDDDAGQKVLFLACLTQVLANTF